MTAKVRQWIGRSMRRLLRNRIVTVRKLNIKEADLSLPRAKQSVQSIDVKYRIGTIEDLDSLTPELGYTEARKAQAKADIESGDVMAVGVHQGKGVSFGWISFRELQIYNTKLPLGPGWAAGGKGVLTIPEYRGKGINNGSGAFRWHLARERGVRKTIAWDVSSHEVWDHKAAAGTSSHRRIGKMWTVLLFQRWRFTRIPAWLPAYLLTDVRDTTGVRAEEFSEAH